MIVPLTLSLLLTKCAGRVGALTMSAVVEYESGGRPFAIGDNTEHRSYFPERRAEAVALARRLLAAGHNVDVGYAQVNSANFAAYGLDVASALAPCANLAAGSRILVEDYRAARARYGAGQRALQHALAAYNAGSDSAGLPYARNVYRTAAELRFEAAPFDAPGYGRRFVPVRRGPAWHGLPR